jgi:hypothetical protein
MTEVIEYPNLNGDDLTARFDRDGTVSVRLTEQHAGACADLIDTCTAAYSLKGVGFCAADVAGLPRVVGYRTCDPLSFAADGAHTATYPAATAISCNPGG